MLVSAQALPPSVLPDISPTRGESGWSALSATNYGPMLSPLRWLEAGRVPPPTLPPCGGDARQGRGGYQALQSAQKFPDENIAWR